MSRWLMQYTVDCRVRTSFTFNNSDHRLLLCRMQTPRRKSDRNHIVKSKPKSTYQSFNLGILKRMNMLNLTSSQRLTIYAKT